MRVPATLNIKENGWWRRAGHDFFRLSRVQRTLLSQVPLTVTTFIVVVFLLFIDPALLQDPLFLSGVVGVGLLTVAAALPCWKLLAPWCMWIIPLADFIPIGLMYHGANSTLSGVSLLSVFPVLWLAWSDIPPVATRLAAFFFPLLIGWAPFIFSAAVPTKAGLIKPLLIPLLMLALAVAATVVTKSLQRQADRLAETSATAQQRAAMLDAIINVAEVGVVVVDGHGNDLLMNRRQLVLHRLATPSHAADPSEAQLLVFDEDRTSRTDPDSRPVRRAVNGEEFSGELYWLGEGAGQRALATSARQMIDTAGDRQGAVVVFHDVTEVVMAVNAQEDFVASVSHELRTPLTSILGYLELAMDELENEAAIRHLAVVARNAERLLSLVNDLLGSARNAMAITVAPGDLHDVILASVEAARPRARARDVELRLDSVPGLLGSFDAVRLGQAVDNLLSNAVKFSPLFGVVDVVGLRSGSGLLVSVRDQGAGMSQEEQASLFTRFYRTESARKAAVPGVGLGLAITKSIADEHQGELRVRSDVGQGSEFTLWIPLPNP